MKNNSISNMKMNLEDHISTINTKKIGQKNSLEEVAQEFESLFVFQMLKSARKAKLAEGILTNEAFDTYQSILDQEYAKTIAKNQSFGIAEALIRQFGKYEDVK
tara:strand:+ start:37 stop:348 length:312 start_codon:yes stop_codon:yes gene_type:complete